MNKSSDIQAQKPKFSALINTPTYQRVINNVLKDPRRAAQFVAGITSAVATNPMLETCEAKTILSGALLGASLNLSPSPQLGHYYLVPFNDNKNHVTNAVFVMGYKGYIQLAKRSGEIIDLGANAIKKGELKSYDPIRERAVFEPIMDGAKRDATETVGYYAWFEERNGFKKEIYWSREKMQAHALKYSKAYTAKNRDGSPKEDSFWHKDFDMMGCKTMLRQLLSKWGSLSVEAEQATAYDGEVVVSDDNGSFSLADGVIIGEARELDDSHETNNGGAKEESNSESGEDPDDIDLDTL